MMNLLQTRRFFGLEHSLDINLSARSSEEVLDFNVLIWVCLS